MFTIKNSKKFILNGVEYIVYNTIAEKIEIFKALSDCETNEIAKFKWNISQENIDDLVNYITIGNDDKIFRYYRFY